MQIFKETVCKLTASVCELSVLTLWKTARQSWRNQVTTVCEVMRLGGFKCRSSDATVPEPAQSTLRIDGAECRSSEAAVHEPKQVKIDFSMLRRIPQNAKICKQKCSRDIAEWKPLGLLIPKHL